MASTQDSKAAQAAKERRAYYAGIVAMLGAVIGLSVAVVFMYQQLPTDTDSAHTEETEQNASTTDTTSASEDILVEDVPTYGEKKKILAELERNVDGLTAAEKEAALEQFGSKTDEPEVESEPPPTREEKLEMLRSLREEE